jgi:hypothetical protein
MSVESPEVRPRWTAAEFVVMANRIGVKLEPGGIDYNPETCQACAVGVAILSVHPELRGERLPGNYSWHCGLQCDELAGLEDGFEGWDFDRSFSHDTPGYWAYRRLGEEIRELVGRDPDGLLSARCAASEAAEAFATSDPIITTAITDAAPAMA